MSTVKIKLLANPLGILKIKGTIKDLVIQFKDNPNINAEKLIWFIQIKPAMYKLEGGTKLKCFFNADSFETFYTAMTETLKALQPVY